MTTVMRLPTAHETLQEEIAALAICLELWGHKDQSRWTFEKDLFAAAAAARADGNLTGAAHEISKAVEEHCDAWVSRKRHRRI